jgi:hypothetical protein
MKKTTGDERRQNQRFPLKLPLKLNMPGEEGAQPTEADMLDISSSGVYFYLPKSLDEQAKIEFYVRLQGGEATGPGVFLHCLGSIIRVDPNAGKTETAEMVGVAVHIDRYRFLRPDEKMPTDPTADTKPSA